MLRALVAYQVILLTFGNEPGWLPVAQGLAVLIWIAQARRGGRP